MNSSLCLYEKIIFLALYLLLVVEIQSVDSSSSFRKKGNERIQIVTVQEQSNSLFSESENNIALKDRLYRKYKKQQQGVTQAKDSNIMSIPIVINTWGFTVAADKAWEVLTANGSALDAVEKGCSICEELQCDGTVGFGGSPDENGETTLDAMIMDGETHSVGAVACLRRIKSAVSVARKVMENTKHTILAGDLATEFAIKMGFKEESLITPDSTQMHQDWKNNSCQPNFWKNVSPDPTQSCGPYSDLTGNHTTKLTSSSTRVIDQFNHDTIGMIAIDSKGRVASGTSSNGARNKIPGRVGDAPIVGAGSYVDRDVGGAAATGDGDIMMRFLPSLIAVEQMRNGYNPTRAAEEAIHRITRFFPDFSGALIAVNLKGEFGAACHNINDGFPYTVRNQTTGQVLVLKAECI